MKTAPLRRKRKHARKIAMASAYLHRDLKILRRYLDSGVAFFQLLELENAAIDDIRDPRPDGYLPRIDHRVLSLTIPVLAYVAAYLRVVRRYLDEHGSGVSAAKRKELFAKAEKSAAAAMAQLNKIKTDFPCFTLNAYRETRKTSSVAEKRPKRERESLSVR
jgi:hypothetical protein